MRALVVDGDHRVALITRPDPTPKPGSVLVRPVFVGLCRTDLEILDDQMDPAYVRLPLIMGHEWSGQVVSSWDDALPVGARVVVEGVETCGSCPECTKGNTNLCAGYLEYGFSRDGAAADLFLAPLPAVHRIHESVSYEAAALVEPAAVVYQALTRVRPQDGQRVLVVGDGSIGLLAANLVRQWCPSIVDVLGARPEQAELARRAGADSHRTDIDGLAHGYDVVVEAAGTIDSVEVAIHACAAGGTVVLVGLAGNGAHARLPIDEFVNGDMTLMGSFSYTSTSWAAVVTMLNAGRLSLDFLVTHRFDLADWPQAIETLRHHNGARGKVQLRVSRP